jgi:hypothetical protein
MHNLPYWLLEITFVLFSYARLRGEWSYDIEAEATGHDIDRFGGKFYKVNSESIDRQTGRLTSGEQAQGGRRPALA